MLFLDPSAPRTRSEVLAMLVNHHTGEVRGLRCPFDHTRLEAYVRPLAPTSIRVHCTNGYFKGEVGHEFSLPASLVADHFTRAGYDLSGHPR